MQIFIWNFIKIRNFPCELARPAASVTYEQRTKILIIVGNVVGSFVFSLYLFFLNLFVRMKAISQIFIKTIICIDCIWFFVCFLLIETHKVGFHFLESIYFVCCCRCCCCTFNCKTYIYCCSYCWQLLETCWDLLLWFSIGFFFSY